MKTKYFIFFFLLGILASCTDNFDEFNTPEKNPTNVEGEFLFSRGEKELVDQISSTNVNLNVWKLFVQYWTETTYIDEANYDIVNRTIADNAFETYYTLILKPFDEAKRLITEDELAPLETEAQRQNKLAIINLLEVYSYHNLVNIFGDVPYTEALNIDNITPKYDDAEAIYEDLLARIDEALNTLTTEVGDAAYESFATADIIYDGDVESWIRFANSLKLKIAINLADVRSDLAQSNVEDAVSAGVFTSPEDNAIFQYLGSTPNTNPLHEDLVLSGRKDFVPANTIVDIMKGLDDPRIDDYFVDQVDTSDNGVDDPIWIGGEYGYSNAYQNYSHIHPQIEAAGFPGILLTYYEVQFYIAEAAARGWNVGQTAEEAYNEAVTASIQYWDGTQQQADDYLAQTDVSWDDANWEQLIGVQSYIAFYTRGLEAYTQWRRLDYPEMNVPEDPLTGGPVPLRFTYPVNEQTLNAANYSSAAEAIGGDDMLTPLFWDVD